MRRGRMNGSGRAPGRQRRGRPAGAARRREGTILIVTMWIVLVLAGLVLILARSMRVEAVCSANELSALQAAAVEQGAIQYVLSHVDGLEGQVPTDTDTPCEAIHIGQGAFWIIRPNFEDDRAYAYGLVDEASRVNLNTASATMLEMIPGMTEELAAALVDWRDTDSNIAAAGAGAESDYYLLLDDPYQCKNSPLETVGETFLVKGADEAILFGEDTNRNGVLDDNEDDGDVREPADNRDGRLERGVMAYVTVYSAEPGADPNGQAKVSVSDRSALSSLLRQNNLPPARVTAILNAVRTPPPRSVLEFYVRSGLTAEEFGPLEGQLTAGSTSGSQNARKGLINVNTAPQEVLACLSGLDDNDIAGLLAKRTATGADLTSIAWVGDALRPANAPADPTFIQKIAAFGNSITTRSFQFSADIVSISGDGRAFRRCRIVVDAQTSPPKVIYRQDLTHLGWPLSGALLDQIRSGGGIEQDSPGRIISQEAPR